MAEEQTSTGDSATPTPATPATGTPAPVGATPPTAALTHEEALKRLAELEHAHGNATEELKRHRSKLTAYEKAEAEQAEQKRLAEEAKLSEIERVKKQHDAIKSQHDALLLEVQEIKTQHAIQQHATELGFIHPEIAYRVIDRSELEYNEDKSPKNAKQLLEKLAKNLPELVRATASTPEQTPGTPAPAPSTMPPAIPAMNPGRTAITQPGVTPTRRPSIGEAYRLMKKP